MQLGVRFARIAKFDSRWSAIAVRFVFYASAIYIFVSDARPLLFHLDAYYYFTIARNLSEGAGFTFDGVSTTTGFHPLWLGILTVIHSIFTGIASFQVAVYVFSAIIFVSGHLLLTKVADKLGISLYGFILVSSVVFLINLNYFQFGLENTLLFFLLSLFLWIQSQNWQNRLLFSAANVSVLLLIYFARLDSVFIVALISAWIFISEWRSGRFVAAISIPFALAVGIFVHLAIMVITVDNIFPTSQIAIKEVLATGSTSLESFAPGGHPFSQRLTQVLQRMGSVGGVVPIRFIGLSVPISVAIATGILAYSHSHLRWQLVLVGLSELILISYYAIVLNGFDHPWYFTGTIIIVALGFGSLLSTILKKLRLLLFAAAISPIVVAVLISQFGATNLGWAYFEDQASLIKTYDQGNNVLVGFTPDLASYFSQVPIRHLEGLVNGYEYLNTYAKHGRITSYLSDIEATHFIISNDPVLAEWIPCGTKISVNADDGLVAYGVYDAHNSYIAVYKISITPGVDPRLENLSKQMCGPAS